MQQVVEQTRLGGFILSTLSSVGITQIFGIPGVHNLELFRDIERYGIQVTIPRHEQGAGFMADAYFRVTGRPAACVLITGPGVLNALTPIAQAWHDSIPMLVLASTIEDHQLGQHSGALHDTPDLVETLRPYTCVSARVRSSSEFAEVLGQVLHAWKLERQRPAYIEVPRDLLREMAEDASELPREFTMDASVNSVSRADYRFEIGSALEEIRTARCPAIIAGGGVQQDRDLLQKFAELIDAPIALTGNAKSAISSKHPLSLGTSIGNPATKRLLESADVVIALGTELSETEYLNSGESPAQLERVIRVDVDPETIRRSQAGSANMRCGDWLRTAVETLSEKDVHQAEYSGSVRAKAVRDEIERARSSDPFSEWVQAIEHAAPPNTIFALDSAQLAYQSHEYMELKDAQRWLAPYGFGTLGPALPMAIGAAVSEPRTPVIAIAGDGGSLFTIAELATAKDLHRQITLIIWDNTGYKEIENSFNAHGIEPVGVVTSADNLSKIAEGFGAHVDEVTSPSDFSRCLEQALARQELSVIRIVAPASMKVQATSAEPQI